jgi:hypothetical protein
MDDRRLFVTCCCLCVLTVAAGIGVVSYDLHQGLKQVNATIEHADDFVSTATVDYAMKTGELDHIIYAARVASDQAALLTLEQRKQLRKTSADSDKSVKALRLVLDRAGLLFKHTDEQLNGNALPSITQAAVENMNTIGQNAVAIGDTARAWTAMINDPKITETLANLANASGHFNVISADGEAMAGDMKIAAHRLAQPPSKIHQVLDAGWTLAKFGSLFIP